jgi:hypothetical protein
MSALPPKADMFSVEIDVCFVPIADIPEQEASAAHSRMAVDVVWRRTGNTLNPLAFKSYHVPLQKFFTAFGHF